MAVNIIPAGITGTGKGVPKQIWTNADLEKMMDTSDEWITSRSGIKQRYIAEPEITTSDLATMAGREALENAGLKPEELDLIILASVTADYTFPASACIIQDKLGATKAAAFDLSAGCTGFIYALNVGAQFINTGMYRNVLVIGAEIVSRVLNWEDRGTCVLFGDGAGAAVLQPVSPGKGIIASDLGSDGSGVGLLLIPGGGSKNPSTVETVGNKLNTLIMSGKDVFKFAVKILGETTGTALNKAGLDISDVDLLIPHQANVRIIESAGKRLKIDPSKVFVNVDRYGNTSAASVAIALAEAVEQGRVQDGNLIALVGFGGGLTWGACIVRWGK